MAFRLYITPAIGSGTIEDPRRSKYFDGLRKSQLDYGFQPLFLVAADLDATTDAAIVANSDVFAFPFNLDTVLSGGQASSARDALELALVPAQWVSANMSWLQVARTVAAMFQFMQRLNVFLGNTVLIDNSTKLNIQWQTVPQQQQQAVLDTAASLELDASFITPTTQVRAILLNFANQWGVRPFQLNEFVF